MSDWKQKRQESLLDQIGKSATNMYYSLNGMRIHLEHYFPDNGKRINACIKALKMLEKIDSTIEELEVKQ